MHIPRVVLASDLIAGYGAVCGNTGREEAYAKGRREQHDVEVLRDSISTDEAYDERVSGFPTLTSTASPSLFILATLKPISRPWLPRIQDVQRSIWQLNCTCRNREPLDPSHMMGFLKREWLNVNISCGAISRKNHRYNQIQAV
jgi:hypothetical protein